MATVLAARLGRGRLRGGLLEVAQLGQADTQVAGVLVAGAQAGQQHGLHGVGLAQADVYGQFLTQTAAQRLHAIQNGFVQFHVGSLVSVARPGGSTLRQ